MARRMGSNPIEPALAWVKDTRPESAVSSQGGQEAQIEDSEGSKLSKQKLHSKQLVGKKSASTRQGLKEGWTRATFIVREEHLEKVKALAYWDRKEIKQVIDEALEEFLEGKSIKRVRK